MSVKVVQNKQEKHLRGHLSRDVIGAAGLELARKEGVENLTMKRLANELSVTPMAIYRHFEDKSDLIDAVLDRFVQETDICNHDIDKEDWSAWLITTYKKMYQGLQSMPSVYPYLSTASRFGPGASEVVEQTLGVLQNAGFSIERATQAANALNGFVIGCAIMDNAFYQDLAASKHAEESALPAEIGNAQVQVAGIDSGLELIIVALKHQQASLSKK